MDEKLAWEWRYVSHIVKPEWCSDSLGTRKRARRLRTETPGQEKCTQAPIIERKREQGESKRASKINVTLPYFGKYYAWFEIWWVYIMCIYESHYKLYQREVIETPIPKKGGYKRKLKAW